LPVGRTAIVKIAQNHVAQVENRTRP